jgi:hypothetical protein
MRVHPWLCCAAAVACHPAGTAKPPRAHESSDAGCARRLVTEQGVRGVIFDASCAPDVARWLKANVRDESRYFVPSTDEIHELELRLRQALEHAIEEPDTVYVLPADPRERSEALWGVRGALREILNHYAEYRRQYAGVVSNAGARRVLVSSFPETHAGERDDSAWTVRWLGDAVDDGGASYWRIQYDLASGTFSFFDLNGSA